MSGPGVARGGPDSRGGLTGGFTAESRCAGLVQLGPPLSTLAADGLARLAGAIEDALGALSTVGSHARFKVDGLEVFMAYDRIFEANTGRRDAALFGRTAFCRVSETPTTESVRQLENEMRARALVAPAGEDPSGKGVGARLGERLISTPSALPAREKLGQSFGSAELFGTRGGICRIMCAPL